MFSKKNWFVCYFSLQSCVYVFIVIQTYIELLIHITGIDIMIMSVEPLILYSCYSRNYVAELLVIIYLCDSNTNIFISLVCEQNSKNYVYLYSKTMYLETIALRTAWLELQGLGRGSVSRWALLTNHEALPLSTLGQFSRLCFCEGFLQFFKLTEHIN